MRMSTLISWMFTLWLFAAPQTVICDHHKVESTFVGETPSMDVYCHADAGYVDGVHCFGLVSE